MRGAGGGEEAGGAGDDAAGAVGRLLVAVATGPGEEFRQRREHMDALLAALGLSAVYVQAVSREMVGRGGILEACRPVRPGEEGLPDSYAANGLNQLQMFLHAWRQGYEHVLVMEDDLVLAPDFADAPAARVALREAVAEAPGGYDLVFLGDCCDIASKERARRSAASGGRVRRWLFATGRGSRCAGVCTFEG